MASSVNIAKYAGNFLRNRFVLVQDLAEIYKPSITRKKLIELIREKAEQVGKSELGRKMRVAKGYYTLEMAPPKMNEMERIKSDLALVKDFIGAGCFKYLTVKQAWLLFLVGLEIYLWFYLGETIGKFHTVGYVV